MLGMLSSSSMASRWRLAVLGLGLLLIAPSHARAAHIQDRIVAIVNKDLVMESDVTAEIASDVARIGRTVGTTDQARQLERAHHVGVTRLIERKLQLQAAKSKGVDVSDDEVSRAVDEMRRQGEKLDANDEKARQSVREQILLMRVVEREVRGGITISEAEMRRYFKEHEGRFALPEEYTLSQILVRPRPNETPEDVRERVRKVLDGLKAGETFEELALRYSDGDNSTRGGRLGLVRQGELHAPIEQALAPLQTGQTTGVIESPEGLHIIRVDDRRPRQFRPFEEVRAEIQALVFAQKTEDFFQVWLAELKDKAYIEVKF